ncbi:outer membrane lipoprotein carrier protein LolA [Gramella sp. GC03-9]|uniref:Outer membrane lipoprotein carrier protein LolA n=1 Tax=Christiangramia oceanisediminis TaxID=2920386 RepID=A0A9X2KY52_9FLAO|nr:outer membrane lipoprotein carrier protein LolA [Gramella oceanisediminis]MCP9200465.1 outer membrane lipoprotein carrier protein LolA [Gramella oceanisediminis]
MRILINIFAFLIFSGTIAQNNLLSDKEGDRFKTNVIQTAEGINSFSAEFSQTKHMQTMNTEPKSVGMVYYKSPDMLKWEYQSPFDYQVLFRDSKLYIVEDGMASEIDLSSSELFEKMGELVAGSVNGKILNATGKFDISYHRDGDSYKARIIPKDENISGLFQEIWVNFNSDYHIRSVRLLDPSGDYTEIRMKNIKINQPIPQSVFQN